MNETGVELLTDGGEDGGSQIESIKSEYGEDNPPYEQNQTPDEVAITTSSANAKPISCGATLEYDTQLSPNFKLKHLSIGNSVSSQN